MLPDFPKTKADVLRLIAKRISALEKERNPLLAQIKTFRQYEGWRIDFERVDLGRKTQEAKAHAAEVELKPEEVPTLFGKALEDKMALLAEKFGALKMKSIFERINEATEETGNRIDATGKPLDGRMLLDLIDTAEGAFDKTGRPTTSFVVHPEMVPHLKKASDEVENDPELKQRLHSINQRQFQQWTDSENRRKLVD